MTRNAAPATTNYTLSKGDKPQEKAAVMAVLKRLAPLLSDEKRIVTLAFVAMLVTSASSLLGPVIISRTVDVYLRNRDFQGVLISAAILLGVYMGGLLASYFQTLA